jgi:hypothetical protein
LAALGQRRHLPHALGLDRARPGRRGAHAASTERGGSVGMPVSAPLRR